MKAYTITNGKSYKLCFNLCISRWLCKSHNHRKKRKVLLFIFLVIFLNLESHEKHCSHTSVSTCCGTAELEPFWGEPRNQVHSYCSFFSLKPLLVSILCEFTSWPFVSSGQLEIWENCLQTSNLRYARKLKKSSLLICFVLRKFITQNYSVHLWQYSTITIHPYFT